MNNTLALARRRPYSGAIGCRHPERSLGAKARRLGRKSSLRLRRSCGSIRPQAMRVYCHSTHR